MTVRIAVLCLCVLAGAGRLAADGLPGESKIVVFLHGVSGDPVATWKGVATSRGIVPEVVIFEQDGSASACHEGPCYSIDLRLPDPPSKVAIAPAVVKAQASRLATALDAIREAPGNQRRSIVLVGHSRGGMVARVYLTSVEFGRKPSPVSDVVFISTPHDLHAKLCGNRPLPCDITYHTLANPLDRIVWIGEQMGVETQQPGISHQAVSVQAWNSRLMHELAGAPGEQVFQFVESIARGTDLPASLEPYSLRSPRSGLLDRSGRYVRDHALKTGGLVGAVVGCAVGGHFGFLGAVVGCLMGSLAGALAGAELSGHSVWRSVAWREPSSCAASAADTVGNGPWVAGSAIDSWTDAGGCPAGGASCDLAAAQAVCRRALDAYQRTLAKGDPGMVE